MVGQCESEELKVIGDVLISQTLDYNSGNSMGTGAQVSMAQCSRSAQVISCREHGAQVLRSDL